MWYYDSVEPRVKETIIISSSFLCFIIQCIYHHVFSVHFCFLLRLPLIMANAHFGIWAHNIDSLYIIHIKLTSKCKWNFKWWYLISSYISIGIFHFRWDFLAPPPESWSIDFCKIYVLTFVTWSLLELHLFIGETYLWVNSYFLLVSVSILLVKS